MALNVLAHDLFGSFDIKKCWRIADKLDGPRQARSVIVKVTG